MPAEHRRLLQGALTQLRQAQQRIDELNSAAREPVALVGIGLRLPGDLADPTGAWAAIREGVDAVGTTPPGRPDVVGAPAGLLRDVTGFDADFFGISDTEAARMDPQQRLTLQVAWEALEDAGIPLAEASARTTGVYVGVYNSDYLTMQLADPHGIDAYTGAGSAHSIVANRLSYLFDLSGPSLAVDTACSSSLTAVHLAVQALRAGECDLALAGGVNVISAEHSTRLTGKVLPFSPRGRCRSFDADADGIVRGEGAVMLVLERASTASTARRMPWVSILGSAVNQDGRTNGLTAPNPRAQREVISRALTAGGIGPERVVYVEAHGTGTPLGDPIEMEALRDVYGGGDGRCAVGSAKAQFGHLEAAAGVAGLVRAALALRHGEVPRQINFDRLNPEIDLTGTRLFVPRKTHQLPIVDGLRCAAVSSFGFGGANAHVVLEEAIPAAPEPGPPPTSLVLALSARDPAALTALATGYQRLLAGAEPDFAEVACATAALRRTHHRYRLAVSGTTAAELSRELAEEVPTPQVSTAAPAVVFVFGGQGGQWAGMVDGFADDPYLAAELDQITELVQDKEGWSLPQRLARGSQHLADTAVAQLGTAVVQLGLARRLAGYGVEPAAVVGHSVGELVAACVAGALSRADLVETLLVRAELTERAARGGRMVAVAMSYDEVVALLPANRAEIGIAAVNSPTSVVVAGTAALVAELTERAAAAGARTRTLPVDYAFHSPLLTPVAGEMTRRLAHLPARTPTLPLYAGTTGGRVDGPLDATHWARNLCDPVLFADAVTALPASGRHVLVELGPHPMLLGDMYRIGVANGAQPAAVLPTLRRDGDLHGCLDKTLAGLYSQGCQLDWSARYDPPSARLPLPAYPWRLRPFWSAPRGSGPIPHPAGPPQTCRVPAPADRFPLDELTEALRVGAARAAGLRSDEIAADTPLHNLDVESIALVELRNQLERRFGRSVPLDVLLSGDTPAGMARTLASRDSGEPTLSPDSAEQLLRRLDEMSIDEVEAAIAALSDKEQ